MEGVVSWLAGRIPHGQTFTLEVSSGEAEEHLERHRADELLNITAIVAAVLAVVLTIFRG